MNKFKPTVIVAALVAVLTVIAAALATVLAAITAPAFADQAADQAELAKKTLNPVASLISVPFQLNYNSGLGPEEKGDQWVLNIQPVIPISIARDWNLISRTIVPLIDQEDILPDGAAVAYVYSITGFPQPQSGVLGTAMAGWVSERWPKASLRGWMWPCLKKKAMFR